MSTFVVLKSANMGNRIKSYVSHLARYNKVKIQMSMDVNLFTNLEQATPEDIEMYPNTSSVWRLLVDPEEEIYCEKYKTIDFLYNKTPEYFKNKYLPIFNSLVINPAVKEVIETFSNSWDSQNMVGVHIRSYLPPLDAGDRTVWIDFEGYEREIESTPKDQKIFFSTDNYNVMQHFKQKYKDRIITRDRNPKRFMMGDIIAQDNDVTKDAFIDMYLLSKCQKKLVATFGSTFPECAWWFGGCKAEVVTPTFWDLVPEHFYNDVFVKK